MKRKIRIVFDIPVLCVFSCCLGHANAGGWEGVVKIVVGCEVKVVNEVGFVGGGAVFMGSALLFVVKPRLLKTNGCTSGFDGVDCGVNEDSMPLLFENGFALLAAVVGESIFCWLVLGKALSPFARGFVEKSALLAAC